MGCCTKAFRADGATRLPCSGRPFSSTTTRSASRSKKRNRSIDLRVRRITPRGGRIAGYRSKLPLLRRLVAHLEHRRLEIGARCEDARRRKMRRAQTLDAGIGRRLRTIEHVGIDLRSPLMRDAHEHVERAGRGSVRTWIGIRTALILRKRAVRAEQRARRRAPPSPRSGCFATGAFGLHAFDTPWALNEFEAEIVRVRSASTDRIDHHVVDRREPRPRGIRIADILTVIPAEHLPGRCRAPSPHRHPEG